MLRGVLHGVPCLHPVASYDMLMILQIYSYEYPSLSYLGCKPNIESL